MVTLAQQSTQAVANRLDKKLGVSTVERLIKSGAAIDIGEGKQIDPKTGRAETVTFQRLMDWPLKRLARDPEAQKRISKECFEAGETFYQHGFLGGILAAPRGVDLNSAGGGYNGGMPIPPVESAYRHREEFRGALAALGGTKDRVGTLTGMVVLQEIDLVEAGRAVFGRQDKAQARALAMEYLRDGLDRLRQHFERPKEERARIAPRRNPEFHGEGP